MSRAATTGPIRVGERLVSRSLWWKELRLLGTVALPLIAIEIGLSMLLRGSLHDSNPAPGGLVTFDDLVDWSFGLWGLLLGALLFGLDREARTLPWLSELPIPPWAAIRTKVGVAALALGVVLIERWLVLGTAGLPVDGWTTFGLLARVALAFVAGGWLTLTDRRRWVSRVLVMTLVIGCWWLATSESAGGSRSVLGPSVSLVGIIVGVLSLHRLLRFPDFGLAPEVRGVARTARSPNPRQPRGLAWLERQLYQRSWWLGLLVPVLLLLTPKARSLPWLFFFPIPFVTVWNAVGLVAEEERDGSRFFLHQLPIPPRHIYGRRLLWALGLGPVLVLEASLLAWLCQRLGTTDLLWQPSVLQTLWWVITLLATLGTLVAAALAPWLPERSLNAVLSLLTVMLFVSTSDIFQSPIARIVLVIVLIGLGAQAVRGASTRWAFAPSFPGRLSPRWLAIGALVVGWVVLLALRYL